jgi:uncharacterized membrane protein
MRQQVFWFLTACVLALACHVAYVLFMPSRNFDVAINAALAGSPANQFNILNAEAQQSLVPFVGSNDLVGICKFNVAKGKFKVTSSLPRGYWSFAVYTIRGEQVYAINDTQADTDTFTVELSRDQGLLASIMGNGAEATEYVGDDLGWRISVTDQEGIAVLWMAIADPLLRPEAEAVMKKSRCFRSD